MGAASVRMAATAALPDDGISAIALFKEDRPRRIDRVISFFGEETSLPSEPWSDE
jgi:hypothetical protein